MEIDLWASTFEALDEIANQFMGNNMSIMEVERRAIDIITSKNNITLDTYKQLMREDKNYNLGKIVLEYYRDTCGYEYGGCGVGVIGFRKVGK